MTRRRRFLLMLPLLVVPFVVVLFVILGGGPGSDGSPVKLKPTGLNVKLPDAHFKKQKDKNKLLLYEEAGMDSVLRMTKIKNDPYYLRTTNEKGFVYDSANDNESGILAKLEKLRAIVHQKTETPFPAAVNRKEDILDETKARQPVRDPKIEQINQMLNKVMAIQHPEILQDSLNRINNNNKPFAYAVSLNEPKNEITGFYDPAVAETSDGAQDHTIEAETAETQVLMTGSTIKLRLLNDIRIHDQVILKNQLIYGIVSLNGERLKIQFSSIRSGSHILPVSLEAFDMDGLAGVFIPGSLNRDVAWQSSDQALGSIGLTSIDPSFGAQAAGVGIQAAKSLMSHKLKLVKVTVPAGYKVFLKDGSQK